MADFIARRQAALQAEREELLEWEAEDQFEKTLDELRYEFEAQMERDRTQRRKYWEVMTAKKLKLTVEQAAEVLRQARALFDVEAADERRLNMIQQQLLAAHDPGEPED